MKKIFNSLLMCVTLMVAAVMVSCSSQPKQDNAAEENATEETTSEETAKEQVKILVLCTGNTCRSQMAHGFLDTYGDDLYVRSGGVKAEERVNPKAVEVMKERGIDISDHTPQTVAQYLDEDWDYVVTVCDHANETCPEFNGTVKHRLHLGFPDPSKAEGDEEFIMSEFRRVRDAIDSTFHKLYDEMEERQ